jgi:hypothetical protein
VSPIVAPKMSPSLCQALDIWHFRIAGIRSATIESRMDTAEIDAFLAEPKTLQGPLPQWSEGSRKGESSASWNLEGSIGIVRAELRFRCATQRRQFPSIAVLYKQVLAFRVDIVPPDECKMNP